MESFCSFISFPPPPHHGDAEDVFRSVTVAHRLSHPAEFRRHVAKPFDRFVSVALDNRQDLIILLFGHVQQLGNLIQFHMQLPNIGALWSGGDRRRSGQLSYCM